MTIWAQTDAGGQGRAERSYVVELATGSTQPSEHRGMPDLAAGLVFVHGVKHFGSFPLPSANRWSEPIAFKKNLHPTAVGGGAAQVGAAPLGIGLRLCRRACQPVVVVAAGAAAGVARRAPLRPTR